MKFIRVNLDQPDQDSIIINLEHFVYAVEQGNKSIIVLESAGVIDKVVVVDRIGQIEMKLKEANQ